MALSGVHVKCSIPATPAGAAVTLPGPGVWSETMPSQATTQNKVPDNTAGVAIFRISSSAPIFFAVGNAPDASGNNRDYWDASGPYVDVFARAGDKLAWILA